MFTEPDFIPEFADKTTRAQALELIGFDKQDVQNIMGALDKIDFDSVKAAIRTMPHSKHLDDLLNSPAN
jgi:hypothetical protein